MNAVSINQKLQKDFDAFDLEIRESLLKKKRLISNRKQEINSYYIESYDPLCEEHCKIEKITAIRLDRLKYLFYILLNILTLSTINILIVWFPILEFWLKYSPCHVDGATHLGVEGKRKSFRIITMKTIELPRINNSHLKIYCLENVTTNQIKYFEYKEFKYIFSESPQKFFALNFCLSCSNEEVANNFRKGLTKNEVKYQNYLFGKCEVDIKVKSYLKLFLEEITDPFYIFQICAVILWFNNNYEKYAYLIIISTLISLSISVNETKNNLEKIKEMGKVDLKVKIHRRENEKNIIKEIDSFELVPGDVFELPEDNMILPCDCLLLEGQVLINEAVLTGESTPIMKTSLESNKYLFNYSDSKHILYSGTKIVQKRKFKNNPVIALVLKTGFNTEKGNLIRSILHPKDYSLSFKADSINYIKIMAVLSLFGFMITVPIKLKNGVPFSSIIMRGFDLLTITVPPALPACLGIGISYSLSRIKKNSIMCINRERINEAGKINRICFDKTGTLTEDHLEIFGFVSIKYDDKYDHINFDKWIDNVESSARESYSFVKSTLSQNNKCSSTGNSSFINYEKFNYDKQLQSHFIECLSSCHSLSVLKDKIIGDPLEVEMINSTKWQLEERMDKHDLTVLYLLTI